MLCHNPTHEQKAKQVGSSSQVKNNAFFFLNIKTCIDRRAKRTGSTNTHCELSLKLFFETIIREDD